MLELAAFPRQDSKHQFIRSSCADHAEVHWCASFFTLRYYLDGSHAYDSIATPASMHC
jgi:hypothetical protein